MVSRVASPSGMTVWHTPRTRKKSRTCSASGRDRHLSSSSLTSLKLKPGSIGLVGLERMGRPCLLAMDRSISVTPSP